MAGSADHYCIQRPLSRAIRSNLPVLLTVCLGATFLVPVAGNEGPFRGPERPSDRSQADDRFRALRRRSSACRWEDLCPPIKDRRGQLATPTTAAMNSDDRAAQTTGLRAPC